VLLDAQTTDRLVRSHLDFLDHRVLRFDGDAVTTIERKMKDADLELARREDNWQITKPGIRDADNLTVFDILKHSSSLRASRIAEFPAKDLAKYGLDKPIAVVTFQLEVDGAGSKHVIKVGDSVKDSAKKDTPERYALVDDKAMVVVLPAELSRHLVAPLLYFADRNLASFSNVDRAELTSATRKAVFSRSARGWKMTQPIEADAEDAAIDELVRSLQRLRADEIVAEKSADLKKFGLDQPFLRWRFSSGDNEQLHLIIGAPENDQPGARRYAKLNDKNQVFLLSSKVTAKAQSECRGRSVWHPSFDADAVSKLTISAADKTFALNRKEKKWQLADDPKGKVNEQAVANTLNILESLKAVRYVVDAKADLKPYGLDKPAWKVEVELAKDKRTLWLGAFEDKSKRMFATVPGTGAVFVLDEIDALILARPLSAYVEEKKLPPDTGAPKKRVLLLWHSPDGHLKDTHEYQLGQKILKATLEKHSSVDAALVCADDPWKEGPELLAKADGVVLFVSEGAKWLSANPERLAAFQACAKRKAGLSVLHWGMGTKDAKNIPAFVDLFGGCHGGPDRKYKVIQTDARIAKVDHPIVRGLADFKARDEFYYQLKFAKTTTPLLSVTIDGESYPVAWAFEREGGGRSFGFSGLHFHENWQTPEYRRLVAQGVLWTLDLPILKDGILAK
jgi:type 1 glutamine amidotransferase